MDIFTNHCIHHNSDGFCDKCFCYCPKEIRCDEANNNNAPCDMVLYYEPKPDNN